MEREIPSTARGRMEAVLSGIHQGNFKVVGFDDPNQLHGVVLPLSDVPDRSLRQGDILPFGESGRVIVENVGTVVHDEHIFYSIRFDLSPST